MKTISPPLEERLRSRSPQSESRFRLIISLKDNFDWKEGVRLLREAGLKIESTWEEIRAVNGSADRAAIHRMAGLPAVSLIEGDDLAQTQAPPDPP